MYSLVLVATHGRAGATTQARRPWMRSTYTPSRDVKAGIGRHSVANHAARMSPSWMRCSTAGIYRDSELYRWAWLHEFPTHLRSLTLLH